MAYGKKWAIGPFTKHPQPILEPDPESRFSCPISERTVAWEVSHVYNPAAIRRGGRFHLFYRADDEVKRDNRGIFHTCRIGTASSLDGYRFERSKSPVLYPDNDFLKPYTWDRGLWDPHMVEGEDATYYLYYNTDNGETHRRCVATSRDLEHWKLYGSIFRESMGDDYYAINGLVVWRQSGDRRVAAKIRGKYWMFFDHHAKVAISDNLIDWEPTGAQIWKQNFRPGYFDSASGEPGTALLRGDGILFIYNAQNHPKYGSKAPGSERWIWALGQALIDPENPEKLLDRLDEPFLAAEYDWEILHGRTPSALVMHDGLVRSGNRWFLYYGGADHVVGLATAKCCDDLHLPEKPI